MHRRLCLLILLALLASCGQPDLIRSGGAPAARGGSTIDIVDFAFVPASLTVEMGTPVTWTNTGTRQHTVTSTGNWDSGAIGPGGTFGFTFNDAGTFAYFCQFHPAMMGEIIVREGTPTNTATPTGTLTDTPTPLPTNTNTPTGTLTDTPTPTVTDTPTGSPTETPSNTPVPPTDTPTWTPSPPTPTAYDCRTGKSIPSASLDQALLSPTPAHAPPLTWTPTPTVTPDCSYLPIIQNPPPPNTPLHTPTFTPTPTGTPVPPA